MRQYLSVGALIASALVAAPAGPGPLAEERFGVVLMHGKGGHPDDQALQQLTRSLEAAGYLVDRPEMCWSSRRIYDRSWPECMVDVDAAVQRLKAKGASAIIDAGLSTGGSGALGYGAVRGGLAGVIALSPTPDTHRREAGVADELSRARQLVSAGRGDESTDFTDWTRNRFGHYSFKIHTTPRIYLTFIEPDGPADMWANVARLSAPLLWLSASDDWTQENAGEIFARAPPNALNKWARVEGEHMQTADRGIDLILAWLRALPRT